MKKNTSHSRPSSDWSKISFGLVGLIVLSYAWPAADRYMWESKTAVLGILMAGLASWAFIKGNLQPKSGISPVFIPFMALALWMLASSGWSSDRIAGIEQAVLFIWIMILATYIPMRPVPVILSWIIVGLSLVEAFAGALQSNSGDVTRLSGTFVNATHHAALLLCGFSVTSIYAVYSRRPVLSIGAVAVSFLLVTSAALSGSRTVVPATLAVLLVLCFFRHKGFNVRKGIIVCLFSLAALMAPKGIASRVGDQLAGLEPMPLGRLELWAASIRMLEGNPLIGTGIAGFADRYFSVRPVSLAKLTADYAHSEPLQLACETGVIGLGLGIWAIFCLWRIRPKIKNSSIEGVVSVMPLVPLAVFSLVDFPLRVPVLAFIAVSCFTGWSGNDRIGGGRRAGIGKLPAVAFILFSVFMAAVITAGHVASLRYIKGVSCSINGQTAEAVSLFESALAVFPFHSESLHALAEIDPSGKKTPERLAGAISLRPEWMPPVVTAFESAMDRGDYKKAEIFLDRANRLDRYGLSSRLMNVRWACHHKNWIIAENTLDEADRLWPNQLDVWMEKAGYLEARGDLVGCRKVLEKIYRVFPHNRTVKTWLEKINEE